MLAGISSRHAGASAAAARHFSLRSQRQLSSFAASRTSPLRLARAQGGYGIARSTNNGAFRSMVLPVSAVRFNSSSSTPTPTPTPTPAPAADATPAPEAVDPSSSSLAEMDLASIPEKLGYLKSLGLDYGWGISSTIEMILETMHIYGGLPWCGSVIAAAILVRVAMIRPTLLASDTTAKLSAVKDELAPIQARMYAASRTGDNIAILRAKQEAALIKEQHGIKQSRIWLPMLQIPIGYCFFKVLRAMSNLPVPTLVDESILWLNDLTVADPYFILPVVTSTCMYLSFKRGGETGMNNAIPAIRKFMQYGLPTISFMVMIWWPALLQLYFMTTGALALVQTRLLTDAKFRDMMNITPLPQPKPEVVEAEIIPPREPGARVRRANESVVIDVKPRVDEVHSPPRDSFIDRTIDGVKGWFKESRKAMEDMVKQYQGKPETEEDNTPKRYTEEELQQAKTYNERRKMEADYRRALLNERRREEYRRKMEEKEGR